jgi:hypothetical protein
MRTKGMGTLSTNLAVIKNRGSGWLQPCIVTATPKGIHPHFNDLYNMNILTIKDYNKDIDTGVFWGWDMKNAIENNSFYSFEFHNRADARFVYVALYRNPIVLDNKQIQYECFISDMNDRWKTTNYFPTDGLLKDKFYESIEQIIENMYINL